MADREKGYGFTAEISDKIDAKYDVALAEEALRWIASYDRDAELSSFDAESVQAKLKDGVILCNLVNITRAGSIKINSSKMAFKQMENICKFLDAIKAYGVTPIDLFQTVDLYEGVNMPAVINGIQAFGRKVQAKGGRGIGPKESEQNTRYFTDEQLRAGDGHVGLQMGSNKGASQAGQNFGKTRAILD